MIQYALKIDEAARERRSAWETRVSGPPTARPNASPRPGSPPTARRLSRRDVQPAAQLRQGGGWTYRGQTVPAFTNIGGLYERATGAEPYKLAPRWAAAERKVNKRTVFNISSTNDIIGGNSGSPLINAKGEVIGAVFDGNIHSLGGAFGYEGETNRSVTVSTAAITEALTDVYDQPQLVAELTGGGARPAAPERRRRR
jgi:hypothetical protein